MNGEVTKQCVFFLFTILDTFLERQKDPPSTAQECYVLSDLQELIGKIFKG